MPKNTNENDILSKLEYIGLDLGKIPAFLKKVKKPDYKPLKIVDENNYKIYKYIPITKIQILLTHTNRLNEIGEKYLKSDTISAYLDSKSEENIIKYTTFLKMLKQVDLEKIEDIENQQKIMQKQNPFLVKYKGNYLWQIYYSDIEDTYFMMVPTEDLEYATFFYLLKKQIELKKAGKEEYIFVPISYEDYSEEILRKSQISDIEKYLWELTKNWSSIYEVYDKKGNPSIQILGRVEVYEKIESEYKIILKTNQEALEFYKLLKALFILQIELPHYYNFKAKINAKGALEFEYKKKKITYDSLMEIMVKEYENAKQEIEKEVKQKQNLEKEFRELKRECYQKEQEYLSKERLIATYLECKKTFLGKVKYFFKAKKLKSDLKKAQKDYEKINNKPTQENANINNEEKDKETKGQDKLTNKIANGKEVIDKNNTNEEIQNKIDTITFLNKEYYTIEEIIDIYKKLDEILQIVKNLELDSKAQQRKIDSLTKKIENASLYIEEIDKHEKSIFEFWKFANKDEQTLLQAPQGEIASENNKLEKVFDYKEDFEEMGKIIDKKQRSLFSKQEADSIYIATTELLEILNNYENEEAFEQSLNNLKKQAGEERRLFSKENFDLFGNVSVDSTKIQLLAGKKHRESKKDKFKILDITKNLELEEYKDRILEILKQIYNVFEKASSPVSMPVYVVANEDFKENLIQVCYMKPEEAILNSKEKQIELYRFNIKEQMPIVYFTNSIYYDNYNKTLPQGMDIEAKCLINLAQYELDLKQKDTFRVMNLEDEFKGETLGIKVCEYDIRKKVEQ